MPESKYVELKLIETNWSSEQKESSSNFQGAENQILVGRRHTGDENGGTECKFATVTIDKNTAPAWLRNIEVKSVRTVEVKESKSDVKCSDGEVIMGRSHSGDENGTTKYTIGEIIAYIEIEAGWYMKVKGCVTHLEEETHSCKESDGTIMDVNGKCIVGRKHNGDENAQTTYNFAKIALKFDPIAEE